MTKQNLTHSITTEETHSTTPWPEDLLNPVDRLIKEYKDSQAIIAHHTKLQAMRRQDLTDHLANGTIEEKFEIDGVTCKYVERKGAFDYDNCPEVLKAKRMAEMNKTVQRKPSTFYWSIS